MKINKMTQTKKILQEHQLWFDGDPDSKGARAVLSQDMIPTIVKLHKLWRKTEGKEGHQADLRSAGFCSLNLSNYDLRHFDMRWADLTNTLFYGTDLRNAQLDYAVLYQTGIYSFQLDRHFAFYHHGDQYPGGDWLQIGCEGMSLKQWLLRAEQVGKRENYTQKQIKRYINMINFLLKLKENNLIYN